VWQELRFSEVGFAEDLEFALRARNAGWSLGLSQTAAVAHSHSRDALYHLRRNVADRLYVAPLVDDRRLSRAATEPLARIFTGAHEVLPLVQGAVSLAPPDPRPLAAQLASFGERLEVEGSRVAPTGELERLNGFVAGRNGTDGSGGVASELRRELLAQLRWEPLTVFSRANAAVARDEAAEFLAKTTGAVIGRALGDSIRYRDELAEADELLVGV
jgi:hypothetical protein